MNLQKRKNDIIKVQVWLNLIVLLISLFFLSTKLIISALILNILLSGTFMILLKYGFLFEGLIMTNKIAKTINNKLGSFLDG